MTTIIKKIKKGRSYYYAVESARVNGKPRIVWQKYLGTLDDIIQRKDNDNDAPIKEADIFSAGGIAAFLGIANKCKIVDIINNIVPKRNQGPSVGEYILLAALNRIVGPSSKNGMPAWYQKTVLSRLWKYDASAFDSQAFWNHMDLISETDVEQIQDSITEHVIKEFKLNPKGLLYDSTNFFTYIATGNKRNNLAQRGRNKQKRDDLRQIGLALLVTSDFQIPLFHRTYQGNTSDQGLFHKMALEICESSKKAFSMAPDTTIAFDKGNISEKAMEALIVSGQHLVAGLPRDVLPELFETPLKELKPLPGISGTKTMNWRIQLWDTNFKVVLAHTESFLASHMTDITERIRKVEKQLNDLNVDISKWSKKLHYKNKPTLDSVKKQVKTIVSTKYIKELINVDIIEHNGLPFINYETNFSRLDDLIKNELGRTMLITTRHEWSDEEIVLSYRGLNNIESTFKHMKNRDYLHWQPAFHWTDQKIKVHTLYCVIALLLANLAHKSIVENNIDISLPQMIEELEEIREVAVIYNPTSSKKNHLTLSKMTGRQKQMAEILDISTNLQG